MFCVFTQVMAQADIFSFEKNIFFSALTYVSGRPVVITHSWCAALAVTEGFYNTIRISCSYLL